MKKMNSDDFILCDLQAKTFELSIEKMDVSSEFFIRRFMKSQTIEIFDNKSILDTNLQPHDILELLNEEYGVSHYGSLKYTKDEMFWIGYLYRYFAITYDLTSLEVYKIIPSKELRGLFLPYHTMDPSQAIERILEAKGTLIDEEKLGEDFNDIANSKSKGRLIDEEIEFQRQYKIFKRIRQNSKKFQTQLRNLKL